MEHEFILSLKIGPTAYENEDIPLDDRATNLLNLKDATKNERARSHRMTP